MSEARKTVAEVPFSWKEPCSCTPFFLIVRFMSSSVLELAFLCNYVFAGAFRRKGTGINTTFCNFGDISACFFVLVSLGTDELKPFNALFICLKGCINFLFN